MSAAISTLMPLCLFLDISSASVPTELQSAGTPSMRCLQPGRRRCRPWRGTKAVQFSGRCTERGVGGYWVSARPVWAGAEATAGISLRPLQRISLGYIRTLALGLYWPEKQEACWGFKITVRAKASSNLLSECLFFSLSFMCALFLWGQKETLRCHSAEYPSKRNCSLRL